MGKFQVCPLTHCKGVGSACAHSHAARRGLCVCTLTRCTGVGSVCARSHAAWGVGSVCVKDGDSSATARQPAVGDVPWAEPGQFLVRLPAARLGISGSHWPWLQCPGGLFCPWSAQVSQEMTTLPGRAGNKKWGRGLAIRGTGTGSEGEVSICSLLRWESTLGPSAVRPSVLTEGTATGLASVQTGQGRHPGSWVRPT